MLVAGFVSGSRVFGCLRSHLHFPTWWHGTSIFLLWHHRHPPSSLACVLPLPWQLTRMPPPIQSFSPWFNIPILFSLSSFHFQSTVFLFFGELFCSLKKKTLVQINLNPYGQTQNTMQNSKKYWWQRLSKKSYYKTVGQSQKINIQIILCSK